MSRPRYYQPGTITPHPKVTHKRLNERCDLYMGEGSELIEAGVLQANMLPPRVSLSWRPAGVNRDPSGSVTQIPGYLTVMKNSEGGYKVYLTVSREEQAARTQAADHNNAEWHRQRVARDENRRVAEEYRLDSADSFRGMGLMYGGLLEQYAQSGCDGFVLAPSDQRALLNLASELRELVHSARVIDTRKRKHLTLAWSA